MKSLVVLVILSTVAHGEPMPEHLVSGTLSFTTLIRGSLDHSGGRFAIGYDNRIDRRSSLGLRMGLSVRPDEFGSVVMPYFGVRAHGWIYPTETVAFKIGGGAELWFNSAPATVKYDEPVMVHVLAEVGPRFTLSKKWFLDVPAELGMLGFFQNPQIFSIQLGAQLGHAW